MRTSSPHKLFRLFSAISFTAFISACSSTSTSPESQNSTATESIDINGKWRIEYVEAAPVIDYSPAYIELHHGQISGNASCNQFTGQYTQEGNSITLSGPFASTAKMCDPALMDQEQRINTALGKLAQFEYIHDKDFLILLDQEKNKLFRLVK